jgi:flagellar protein FliJ
MKPFRLITVERLRGRHLDLRAQELHAAARLRDDAVAERDRLVAQLAGSGGPAVVGLWTGANLDLANNFRQVLRQQIQDQHQRIAELEGALGLSRAAWLAARGELRAVQALHDRHRVAVRAERARLEQRELDERAATARPSIRDTEILNTEVLDTGAGDTRAVNAEAVDAEMGAR